MDSQNLPDDPFGAYLGQLLSETIQQIKNDYPLIAGKEGKDNEN
jgi:hypothetical protein